MSIFIGCFYNSSPESAISLSIPEISVMSMVTLALVFLVSCCRPAYVARSVLTMSWAVLTLPICVFRVLV